MNKGPGASSGTSAMDAILGKAGISGLGSIIGDTPVRSHPPVSSELERKPISEILGPELNLSRLGYTRNKPIDWIRCSLIEKKDLHLELCKRIKHKKNVDCLVLIGGEEFICHLIVLQCYSGLFDGYTAIKKIELPPDKCTAAAFSFIYDWMVREEQSYKYLNRENVLDILNSSTYLKIKELAEQCWTFVDSREVFNEATAFLLYMEAKAKGIKEVQELMIPRIQTFFLILVSSQDWLELDVDDVKNLLSSNYICINCEVEVFMSAVRWLTFDWANREKFKYEVLKCVRFGNIAAWQLIDIKRNPENAEFMELLKDPDICKLIDEGLAYVIIKYWYRHENEDLQHWNTALGLQEPVERNWSGLEQTYFTFRDFLIFLDKYRKSQLLDRSKSKVIVDKKSGASATVMPPKKPLTSLLEDFLAKKKAVFTVNTAEIQMTRGHQSLMENTDLDTNNDQLSELEEEEKLLNALKMFTPSKNDLALSKMNRLSASVVSPHRTKQYSLPSSLFLPNHEAVLVFGGIDPYLPYGTEGNTGQRMFRYVPDSNIWEPVGHLPEPRHYHAVGFFKGRVYVAGGTDPRDDEIKGNSFVVNTVWSFEPVRRRWFSEPSLNEPRKHFGLVVCNRKMFAMGGFGINSETLASVECFNPRKGSWKFVACMKCPRAGFAYVKYRDSIWVAGGQGFMHMEVILDVVESYDLKKDQWTTITSLSSPRCFCTFFTMYDRLYLIGGAGYKFDTSDISCSIGSVEIWNPYDMTWQETAQLTIPRHGHSVAYIGTQIFVLGGITTDYLRCLNNVECYCIKRDAWIRGVASLPICLSGHAAITLPPSVLLSHEKKAYL